MKKYILLTLALLCGAFLAPAFAADTSYEDVTGQPATFTVAHDGTGTFSYQWKKDGAPIASATAKSFRIASLAATDAGTYTVQVTNKAGTILSDKGVVTIIVSPTTGTITIQRL